MGKQIKYLTPEHDGKKVKGSIKENTFEDGEMLWNGDNNYFVLQNVFDQGHQVDYRGYTGAYYVEPGNWQYISLQLIEQVKTNTMEEIKQITKEMIGQEVVFEYEGKYNVHGKILNPLDSRRTYLIVNNIDGAHVSSYFNEEKDVMGIFKEYKYIMNVNSGDEEDIRRRGVRNLRLKGSSNTIQLISNTKFIKINQND